MKKEEEANKLPSAPTLLRFEMAHGGICKDVFREVNELLDSLGGKCVMQLFLNG